MNSWVSFVCGNLLLWAIFFLSSLCLGVKFSSGLFSLGDYSHFQDEFRWGTLSRGLLFFGSFYLGTLSQGVNFFGRISPLGSRGPYR